MRLHIGVFLPACIALAAVAPLLPARGQQVAQPKADAAKVKADAQPMDPVPKPPEGDAQPVPGAAAGAGGKDTRLTLKDIEQLRRQRIAPEQVLENVAEQGRGFEVTAEVAGQLRGLGFQPAQIDAIRGSPAEPLVPGKYLITSDERRNQIFKEMTQVAVKSGAAIEPIASQHVTLWAAKETQRTYLPDVQKLEKLFHTKYAEPIRSGLDKRSTHVVLLKDHAEYEAWCRAMFDLFGERFDEKDNPGFRAEYRSRILKGSIFNGWEFCAISVRELHFDWVRRELAVTVGRMYICQLANLRHLGALETGFADEAEAVVTGSPSVMFSDIAYHEEERKLGSDSRAWIVLVQGRMATSKATPPGKLLQMDTHNMLQPHFAEAWTLVGLLSKQPAKFGELLLTLRNGDSELEAIEKVYGWDEKKLTAEWRAYVMAASPGAAAGRAEPKTATPAKAKPSAAGNLRTWHDATGSFSVEAEFVSAMAGVAKLRKTDGSTISVPIDKLSDEDQKFIRNRK
jgi:hypothetical protein